MDYLNYVIVVVDDRSTRSGEFHFYETDLHRTLFVFLGKSVFVKCTAFIDCQGSYVASFDMLFSADKAHQMRRRGDNIEKKFLF